MLNKWINQSIDRLQSNVGQIKDYKDLFMAIISDKADESLNKNNKGNLTRRFSCFS